MASTYLSRTGTTATDGKKFTLSLWFKRGNLGSSKELFCIYLDNTNRIFFRNNGDDFELQIQGKSYSISGSRQFRDTSAWYHFVVTADSTEATDSDRIKWYVNGERQATSAGSGYPALNNVFPHGQGSANYYLGNGEFNNTPYSNYWDGSMSHVHFIDGTAYDASAFGQYDANGVWTIKTSPSVTYGTNGFFILKDSASVTDQSGNGNNFTVAGGTLTNTEDSPSNVFCTLNPLDRGIVGTATTYLHGNTQWTAPGNNTSNAGTRMTLGASSGKYYFEAKLLEATYIRIGVHLDSVNPIYDGSNYLGNNSGYYAIYIDGSDNIYAIVAGSNQNVNLGSVTNNDIIGCAFDFDNNKFYFSKNGTWLNSGDPTSGATGTGSFGTLASGLYIPAVTNVEWSTASSIAFNFGNGYFGTTAVASAGTNASGNGIFEYDVPTGYTALSTKGLNL